MGLALRDDQDLGAIVLENVPVSSIGTRTAMLVAAIAARTTCDYVP
jgi:hypothetical protein